MSNTSSVATNIQLPLGATVASQWIDLRFSMVATLQVSTNSVSAPIGVITIEYSNDVGTIELERWGGQPNPATTNAAKVGVTAAATVLGTNLATGYDGTGGLKTSFVDLTKIGIPHYVRVVYTRTSGGATDTLLVNVTSR